MILLNNEPTFFTNISRNRSRGARATTTTNPVVQKIKQFLSSQMRKAKRNRGWFRLSNQERSLFGLALRLDIKLESAALMHALVSILKKMKELGDKLYIELRSGLRLAWAFSEVAVSAGNDEARDWRNDLQYARYLGRFMSSNGGRRF